MFPKMPELVRFVRAVVVVADLANLVKVVADMRSGGAPIMTFKFLMYLIMSTDGRIVCLITTRHKAL